jgi:hypothetical protein
MMAVYRKVELLNATVYVKDISHPEGDFQPYSFILKHP